MADDGGDAGGTGKASGSESGTVLSSAATTVSQLQAIVKGLQTLRMSPNDLWFAKSTTLVATSSISIQNPLPLTMEGLGPISPQQA